jgi:two-component system LytT family sensor kinase
LLFSNILKAGGRFKESRRAAASATHTTAKASYLLLVGNSLSFIYFIGTRIYFYYFTWMNKKRLALHVLFWLGQYSISLYNELYLSVSFSLHPTLELLVQSVVAVFFLLLIKMAAAYYILYALIPRWIKHPAKIPLYLEGAGIILLAALCLRITMHYIVWPWIYEEAGPVLTPLQITARFFYSLLDLLQVAGLASAIRLFKLRIHAINQEKILVQEKLRSEMLHLKAQLNPHFLFNAINSIYSLARTQSPATPDAVMQLSKILRYLLYETEQKTIALSEELNTLQDYIELQQLRFSGRLSLQLEKEIDDHTAAIAPMLLLPLVENAYKHGSEEGGTIRLRVALQKQQFSFAVSNPTSGIPFKNKGEEGIGLPNIKRRLELTYRHFSLETSTKENTFKAELKIDLAGYAGLELFDHRR